MQNKRYTKLKYKNITVSGKICTGTSTLSRLLKQKLGWEHWDAGSFFRDYCQKMGFSLEQTKVRSDNLRREVDYQVRKKLQSKSGLIHEGWLAGFFSQGLSGVLKVLLVCEDELRIDRLVNRDRFTVGEAKRHISEREKQNYETWRITYKKEWEKWVGKKEINFFDPQLYDLVIDTRANSREQTLKIVLEKLCYHA